MTTESSSFDSDFSGMSLQDEMAIDDSQDPGAPSDAASSQESSRKNSKSRNLSQRPGSQQSSQALRNLQSMFSIKKVVDGQRLEIAVRVAD